MNNKKNRTKSFNSFVRRHSAKLITAGALLTPLVAHAEEEGGAAGVFTSLTSQISTLATAGWALLAVALVALIGMKLVKKFANRSS